MTGSWGNPIAITLPTSPDGDDPTDDTGLGVGSQFGHSVAISDVDANAIVGAPGDDNERGNSAGSAYIYERDANRMGVNRWGNPVHLPLPSGNNGIALGSNFGSSVAIFDYQAIVGAPGDDNEEGEDAGSVYTYERDILIIGPFRIVGDWIDSIVLTLPTLNSDDPTNDIGLEEFSDFGNSVAIDRDYAIVGARYDDNEEGGRCWKCIYIQYKRLESRVINNN